MSNQGKKYDPDFLGALMPYCKTVTQRKAIRALIEHGSSRKAAEAAGTAFNSIIERVRLVQKYAAEQGFAPEHDWDKTAPSGYFTKGVSTNYGPDGEIRQQWVLQRKRREDETLQAIEEELKDRFSRVRPLKRIPKPRKPARTDVLPVVVLSDPHVGMYAWGEEVGDDWDLKIAQRMIVGAVDYLIDAAPHAETCLIANLGDYFHAENLDARTYRGGNNLDVDSRWQKVIAVGIEMLVTSIETALRKYKRVRVVNKPGNHDPHAGILLNAALAQAFRGNPRVEFDMTPSYYSYFRFGKVLLGITHGDKRVKPSELPLLMATDRPEDWGQSQFRAWLTGHVHHQRKFEPTGGDCTIESFRIMAPKDRWHHGEGYRSGRELQEIIYHRDYGETGRVVVTPEMLKAGVKA